MFSASETLGLANIDPATNIFLRWRGSLGLVFFCDVLANGIFSTDFSATSSLMFDGTDRSKKEQVKDKI